jgi:N-acetyl-anhydromuramoyl-L-alanine amidase
MSAGESGRALDAEGWLVGVRRLPSPNCDDRPEGQPVRLVVVHAISLPPGEFGGDGIVRLFTNTLDPGAHPYFSEIRDLRVSAHFLIRRDGSLIQFVPCRLRAWHAGASQWRGLERCNDFSVGIELEGCDERAFEAAQYDTLARLVSVLRSHLPIEEVLGHADISPGRKSDPGPNFDWAHLHRKIKTGQA